MRRREFIAGLGSAAAWPVVAGAQQPAMPVIGWLNVPVAPGTMERFLPAFTQGLADTGYVVGRNVSIEPREGGKTIPVVFGILGDPVELGLVASLNRCGCECRRSRRRCYA
jgi:putative ABC transport system substrate-binding protein